jgi:flavin-dependent dehydrogenase
MSEAVVIGGGLAGGAIAALLAGSGRRVHLIERQREPADKVCGEFLSIEAQRSLARLGLDLDHLGASRIRGLCLAWGTRRIELPLPFMARGLSRKRLDTALLAQAAAAGARIDRGVTVRSIRDGCIETTAGDISPDILLLASGKHDVRGAARVTDGCENGYVGFKMHWRLSAAARASLGDRVDIVLFQGGYAGLQMVEDNIANLCLLVDKSKLRALGGTWAALLPSLLREPRLGALLSDAEAFWPAPLTISAVPYGFLHDGAGEAGFYRLGDQAAVIPSFCGEGMAIALHTASTAASVIFGGGNPRDHQHILRRELARRLRLAVWLQRRGRTTWSRRLLWSGLHCIPSAGKALVHLTRAPRSPPLTGSWEAVQK